MRTMAKRMFVERVLPSGATPVLPRGTTPEAPEVMAISGPALRQLEATRAMHAAAAGLPARPKSLMANSIRETHVSRACQPHTAHH